MKFSCTQENLNQGLSIVSHIANRNINLPILGNVLIKCDDKVLRFLSTNLEIAVSCVVRGKVEEPGEFTVPSRLFSDYVSLLPKERVDVSQLNSNLTVSCGQYQTKINGITATEFPLIPPVEKKHLFSVGVADFRRAVGQVLFAVAPNESRPEISGVLFRFTVEKGEPRLVLAATDSYRLAERTVVLADRKAELCEPISVIVPARTVAEIVRILGIFRDSAEAQENIEIAVGDSQVVFSYDNMELASRIIEGRYPDYRQLIPESFATVAIMEKEDLQRAVKTTSLFSRAGLNDISLRFAPGEPVHVNSANTQSGEHAADLEAKVEGKENAVTVNHKYFLDGVNNIEGDVVALSLVDGLSPCVIRPLPADGREPDYLYIVMPIRQ
ncbi:MAG: DNA polymerase III subunit beta [Patescibacteria group bacterium]|nr:DNA polymerase III subunit beta [Patescibacteria group bacterium]